MSFEESFIGTLNEDELRAVIAHELGHVWIFTHHPYLQTEALANNVAMRVVTRDSLERVYAKVRQHGGTTRDLSHYLGNIDVYSLLVASPHYSAGGLASVTSDLRTIASDDTDQRVA